MLLKSNLFPLLWSIREIPLQPKAVVSRGTIAARLAQKLLEGPQENLSQLQGVSGTELLVILGEEKMLPWVDGVMYLGKDEQAPQVYMPTYLQPNIPSALLEQILLIQAKTHRQFPPFGIIPVSLSSSETIPCLFSVQKAFPLSKEKLAHFLSSFSLSLEKKKEVKMEKNEQGGEVT